MQMENPIKEFVEANGNRVRFEEAVDEFEDRHNSRERCEEYVEAWVDEDDELVTDRFGGHDRIEKVVY